MLCPKGMRVRITIMSQKLRQAFKNIIQLDPPEKLVGLIFRKIKLEESKNIRRKMIFSYAGLISSVLAACYTSLVFGQAILKSEFWSILKLISSDLGIVARNYGDFILSLMETFPVIAFTIIIAPIFTLLLSLGYYFDLNNNRHKYI